ncbi:MAG: NAD(P)H-hydrate dehydratase [Acidobacteria bacterium]|nr:NAD(P)H-hydrate dehydratase [Acidobacteriota bacterium]
MRVLNASQMREADRRTIDEIGIPALVLMENAGRQVVAAMEARFENLADHRVAIICGRGNNGGDGCVVARTLHQRGVEVGVFVIGEIAGVKGAARTNLEVLGRLSLSVVEITNEQEWELHSSEIGGCHVIVDALFGTGLKTPLQGLLGTVVADLNSLGIPIVSIDLPSGLSADTNELIGDCIEATMTVTLGAAKLPLVLPPGQAYAGRLVIADIGIPNEVLNNVEGDRIELLTREDIRRLITPRAADAHKGDFGHVLVVAGSRGKTGAAHLAAMGALRSGAGLVTVAAPRSCQSTIATLAAEYMTEGLEETETGGIAAPALQRVLELPQDVVAIGPGLGSDPETRAFVRELLAQTGSPIVLDADAVNAFAGEPDPLSAREGMAVILTPHPGEMARLLGITTEEVQGNRVQIARDFASHHRLYVILKGHRTIIATPKGEVFINPTGNPGMATGGTGDVLTGMIAAWFGQLLDAEAACKIAVFLHGAAGDLADADLGEVAMTAGDLLDYLGDALLEVTARKRVEG